MSKSYSGAKQFHALLFAVLVSFPLGSEAAPLAAEDASHVVREWYYAADGDYWKDAGFSNSAVFEALLGMGVKPVPFPFHSNWLQDQLFFDRKGGVVLNADYPADRDVLQGTLTIDVFSDEEYGLKRIDEKQAALLGGGSRVMHTSFLEGGAVLSGTFKNGEPYVITTESVVERMIRFVASRSRRTLSREQALNALASDLEVPVANLFLIPVQRHLDTLILPLPGGRLLVHDPKRVLTVLSALMRDSTLGPYERGLLERSLPHYSQSRATEAALQRVTDAIEDRLKSRFEIHREAGLFEIWDERAKADRKSVV